MFNNTSWSSKMGRGATCTKHVLVCERREIRGLRKESKGLDEAVWG